MLREGATAPEFELSGIDGADDGNRFDLRDAEFSLTAMLDGGPALPDSTP